MKRKGTKARAATPEAKHLATAVELGNTFARLKKPEELESLADKLQEWAGVIRTKAMLVSREPFGPLSRN